MTLGNSQHYRQSLGIRIRELRTAQGLSLRKLGLMVGMDYSYLFAIEHGTANATIDALVKIADGLDVELKEFFI